jgi:hypothetical protein
MKCHAGPVVLALLMLAGCNCGPGKGPNDGGSGGGSSAGGGSGGGTSSGGGSATGGGSAPTCPPWDGGSFAKVMYSGVDTLNNVAESSPGDVWIQGDILMRIQTDGGFGPLCLKSPAMPCISPRSMAGSCGPFVPQACDQSTVNISSPALWASGTSDVWSGNGLGSVMHFDGQSWTSFNTADNRGVTTLFGTGPSDVWGIDHLAGYTGHYDGMAWSHVNSGCSDNALWASDAQNVWSAGAMGIAHGTAPCGTSEYSSTTALRALWGARSDDIWAAGAGGLLLHRDLSSWTPSANVTPHDLNALWGCSASNIWAVGAAGTVLHFDGATWQAVSVPTTADLFGVGGIGNDVWITGAQGTILHR